VTVNPIASVILAILLVRLIAAVVRRIKRRR
jgi:hypothetical protein